MRYSLLMIRTFKHKGLQAFFETGITAKLKASHVKKLRLILAKLHASVQVEDMNFPGSNLHPLKGNRQGFWSVDVSGNWRVIFKFENEKAYDVDYVDYH